MTYPWVEQRMAQEKQEDIPWYGKPKQWWEETAEEKIGEGISKIPILPEALEKVAPAFEWVHENLEKPFAAIVTSPFSPDIPWKQGESWVSHQKREYDEWEAPSYVKGVTEFAMPLWWMPWFGWAKAGAKALGVGSKTAAALAKTGKTLTVAEKGLPSGELLDRVLFKSNLTGKIGRAMEHVPVINKVVKMVGGEAVFTDPVSQAPLQITRRALVKQGFIADMRNGIKALQVPKLQVLGNQNKILGMDAKGIVTNIVDKAGKSQYVYDVIEGAIKNPDNYKFLTSEAKQYVETLSSILDDTYKLAKKEGVKVPKGTIVHRIVKGKTGPKGYEATEYGSLFEAQRTHNLMREGVEAGVDYGTDIAESVSSTIDHYINAISRKRFEKEVGKLGKRPIDMWNQLPESMELNMLKAAEKEVVLKAPERLKELTLMKKDYMKRYAGAKQILGENMAKFSRHPVFKNSIFPKEVVKAAERLLSDDSQKWLQTAANISGTSRMLTAAMDFSAPFIQGAALWGRNPMAWTKAVKDMFGFFVDPQSYFRYMTRPDVNVVRMDRILHGGSSSTFEFFKALQPLQKQVGKIPVAGKGIKTAIGQTYGRAEVAFSGWGEVARNEMWKALRKPGMTDGALMDLSRTIDRMTGVMSTEALAIGRTQQDFENAFVFFAPRYTRAGLSFVSDALRGGMAGAEARKALGSLMAAGGTFYYGMCKALDQQPNFNPSSGRFMTVKIGESHVGVGGIMTALLRLGYDVGVTAIEDPVNLVKPLSEGKLNRWDNPFIKFIYSRTAPLTSTLYSTLVENTNYFGEPFEDVGDWGKFMVDKVTPIMAQETTEAIYEKMRGREAELPEATTIGAEFAGLRRFPKSPWEVLDEERDRKSIEQFGQPYDNLTDLQQTRVDKDDIVRKLQKDVDAATVTRGDEVSVGFINRERERDAARQVYEETLWNLQKAFDDGAIDGIKFREEMANAGYGLGVTYEHIDSQPEYKDVLKKLQEPRKIKDKHVSDIAYAEFMDRLYRKDEQGRTGFEDKYGLFQYDEYNQFIEQFKTKWGDEIYQYVLDMKVERDKDLPPLAKEYQTAKEVMKPYWAVQEEVERIFGKMFAESSRGQSLVSKLRKQKRLSDPNIERYYTLFYQRQ